MSIKQEVCVCNLLDEKIWTTGKSNGYPLKGKLCVIHADNCPNKKGSWVWDIGEDGKQLNYTTEGYLGIFNGKQDQVKMETDFWDNFKSKHNDWKTFVFGFGGHAEIQLYFLNPVDVDTVSLGGCDKCGKTPVWLMKREIQTATQEATNNVFCLDCTEDKIKAFLNTKNSVSHNGLILDNFQQETFFHGLLKDLHYKHKLYLEFAKGNRKSWEWNKYYPKQ